MSKVKLAEALLRRKELQGRLDRMGQIKQESCFEVKASRKKVTDDIDDVIVAVPKMTYSQFQAEYNHNAQQLRMIDASIQQANWTTEVEVGESMIDWVAPPAAPK